MNSYKFLYRVEPSNFQDTDDRGFVFAVHKNHGLPVVCMALAKREKGIPITNFPVGMMTKANSKPPLEPVRMHRRNLS